MSSTGELFDTSLPNHIEIRLTKVWPPTFTTAAEVGFPEELAPHAEALSRLEPSRAAAQLAAWLRSAVDAEQAGRALPLLLRALNEESWAGCGARADRYDLEPPRRLSAVRDRATRA